MRSHGDERSRRRSKVWVPIVIIVLGGLILLFFVVLDQFSHRQERPTTPAAIVLSNVSAGQAAGEAYHLPSVNAEIVVEDRFVL